MNTLLALGLANVRYWTCVASPVRRQLEHWRATAERIPDTALRSMALQKLAEGRFNVQLAASIATRAPRARRPVVVRALVALQVMYDYLDLLGENAPGDRSAYPALIDAVRPNHARAAGDYRDRPDGTYLQCLADTVRCALGELPASAAVAGELRHGAELCVEAQTGWHSGDSIAMSKLNFASSDRASTPGSATKLAWPETVAAASASVLTLHALIAAAAVPCTTISYAQRLADAYSFLCAVTMLDSALDESADLACEQLNYVRLCGGRERLAERLALLAGEAHDRLTELRDGAHHRVTLIGIVAYYCSAGDAEHDMRPFAKKLRAQLGVSVTFALAILRVWRLIKRFPRGRERILRSDPLSPTRSAA